MGSPEGADAVLREWTTADVPAVDRDPVRAVHAGTRSRGTVQPGTPLETAPNEGSTPAGSQRPLS